jgi:hypothetical protein
MPKYDSEWKSPSKPIEEFVPLTNGVRISEEGLTALKNKEIAMMSELKDAGFKYYSYSAVDLYEDDGTASIEMYVSQDNKTWYHGVYVSFKDGRKWREMEEYGNDYEEDHIDRLVNQPYASICSYLDNSCAEYN